MNDADRETFAHRTRTNQRAAHERDIAEANDVEALTTSDARLDGQLVHGFAPITEETVRRGTITPETIRRGTIRDASSTIGDEA